MLKNITELQIFDISVPTAFSHTNIKLLEEASRALGEVNNFASGAIEYDYIIETLKNIESLASAKIEGTTGNLRDLYAEKSLSYERKAQLKLFSAINYKIAIGEVESIIRNYKVISVPFIRHLHKVLTENDPATAGIPGDLRKTSVVIQNSKLGDFYPAHELKISDFINRYVKDSVDRKEFPDLINAAIAHYQFEAIHPFRDGNGRTGRMLIMTDLMMCGAIKFPVLNLSQYFESNRNEYIQALRVVSEKQTYTEWIAFFLTGVREQSIHNLKLIEDLRKIEELDSLKIHAHFQSASSQLILRHSLNKLYVTVESTTEYLRSKGLNSKSVSQVARTNILKMVQAEILGEADFKHGKQKVYVHRELQEYLLGK